MSAFQDVDSVGSTSDVSIAITSSSASAEGSDCCSSPCRSRKRYECVPESIKTTPNYVSQRIRNRSAVRKFREKSKTTAKRQEDQLELLLYRYAAHKNIICQLNEILSSEAQARLNFQTQLASVQALPDSSIMDSENWEKVVTTEDEELEEILES
ncbi:hypothetical protein MN116_006792 [Schistosoma mekongi]|uniref:BZIP domain-containing protein n=1 Tax=Schistosoma mekongi TaxID=38744 RepID=A0AAE1Z8B3_SCHME|nr:hypothetical protein MN116_006792 [Schistosoma mekongi]